MFVWMTLGACSAVVERPAHGALPEEPGLCVKAVACFLDGTGQAPDRNWGNCDVQIELMSYTHAAEDKVIERYLLEKGVPVSLDKEIVIGKVARSSPHFLKDILFDFFIADVPVETLRALPRHRPSSYEGYRQMSRDAAVRVVASMDGLELLDFFEGNLCSQKSAEPTALVYAMLAAAELACPSLFGGLAVPCPAGKCDLEKGDCRRTAREWAKRIQKLTRISCEAFVASRPNYVMTFDFSESLGYPVVLTVRKS